MLGGDGRPGEVGPELAAEVVGLPGRGGQLKDDPVREPHELEALDLDPLGEAQEEPLGVG